MAENAKDESAQCYRFGVFEADAATGELRRQGMRIKLNAQPFQVLLLLLGRAGQLLTREEIARELWPDGTFVDYEHGVNSAVNRIREALGDTASSPRFVETLARRGYRFVAPVERIGGREDAADTEASFVSGRAFAGSRRRGVSARRARRQTSRTDSGDGGGTAEGSASSGADAFQPVSVDVPGVLCGRAGEPGGD